MRVRLNKYTQQIFGMHVYVACTGLASTYGSLGRCEEQIKHQNMQLEISTQQGNQEAIARGLGNLGSAHFRMHQTEKAMEKYQEALKMKKEMGCNLACDYGNLGNVYGRIGDHETSLMCRLICLRFMQKAGDATGE